MTDLFEAQRHSVNNRATVETSSVCGCFYCMHIFRPTEIVAWTGLDLSKFDDPNAPNADTALCPGCGSESVLGDAAGLPITGQFLGRMHVAWFERTIVQKPSDKK